MVYVLLNLDTLHSWLEGALDAGILARLKVDVRRFGQPALKA